MKIQYKIIPGLFLLFLLSACSGKGSNRNYDEINFEIGEATKTQVVNHLGLPQKIQRDRRGYEHYIYEGKSHLSKICTTCEDSEAESDGDIMPLMIRHALLGIGAEFVFNEKRILISKFTRTK